MLRREPYGTSSDVWSVGCCVYTMATGELAWGYESQDPSMDAIRVSVHNGQVLRVFYLCTLTDRKSRDSCCRCIIY